jgi:multicomponent Na+:H+ antiporter subunit D
MTADILLIAFLIAPISHALAIGLAAPFAAARDTISIVFSLIYALLAFSLLALHWDGETAYAILAHPLPTADFAFAPEPFGLTVAATLAGLAALNAPFAVGYFRALQTHAPARAQVFIVLSIGMACWAALAANLFTFLLCYQAMAALSFPLIGHGGDPTARRAGRIYLGILLSASFGLLLPAMVWTHALAGRLDFVGGGLLAGKIGPIEADVLLALFGFGFAATALAPLYGWLPAAMRAPTPAAGLVHAVAVPSIGALGLVKTVLLIFGTAIDHAGIARPVLVGLALGGGCFALLISLSKDDLKLRLAYATCAHIGLAVAGALIATPVAIFAAAFQIIAHGVAKASLFFTVGAAEAVSDRTRASEMTGLGRRMPWAFTAFSLAALSVAGVPPLAGAWSIVWLAAGAASTPMSWAIGLLLLSSVLSLAAFLPTALRALFGPAPIDAFKRPDAASILLVAPVAIGGAVSLGLIYVLDPLSRFLGVRFGP